MILEIKKYGDPVLRKKAETVKVFDAELKKLCNDMLETMYEAGGMGLAANQIGISKSVIVLDASTKDSTIVMALANPEVSGSSKEKEEFEEGCLSFPGITEKISRPKEIKVKAFDPDGNELLIEASGLLAIILQHEIDHINGVIFTDRMSPVRRMLHNKELKELKKKYGKQNK
ncbi:MAG: peptide deformylase [Candidatus Goldiibacteriota bacterium]